MIDHINLPVTNLQKSAQFYRPVLATLHLSVLFEYDDAIGFGRESWEFGLVLEPAPVTPVHVALAAESQQDVMAFYDTALRFGGIDNGAPGLRSEYGSAYFAAFLLDFDGHNIEAVTRTWVPNQST